MAHQCQKTINRSKCYPAYVLQEAKHMDYDTLDKFIDKLYRHILYMRPGVGLTIDNFAKRINQQLFKAVVRMYQEETGNMGVQIIHHGETIYKRKNA